MSTCSAPRNESASTLVAFSSSREPAALSVSEATFDLQPRSLSGRRSLSGSYNSYSNLSSGCESGVEVGGEEGGGGGETSGSGMALMPAASGASSSTGGVLPIMTMLMDMGFLRPQVNAALER